MPVRNLSNSMVITARVASSVAFLKVVRLESSDISYTSYTCPRLREDAR